VANFLRFAPFCPAVLEPNLDSCLCQSDFHGQFLPGKDIRVVGSGECFLQFVQLEGGKRCSVSPLFSTLHCVFQIRTLISFIILLLDIINLVNVNFFLCILMYSPSIIATGMTASRPPDCCSRSNCGRRACVAAIWTAIHPNRHSSVVVCMHTQLSRWLLISPHKIIKESTIFIDK